MLIVAAYSLERMHSYINSEQEPKPTTQGTPPAYWPASGDLRVEKLSARYSLVRDMSTDVHREDDTERRFIIRMGRKFSMKYHSTSNLVNAWVLVSAHTRILGSGS
jgi:hypothetical protein